MIGLEVLGIRIISPEDPPVLLLQEEGGTRCLPIWIGAPEAAAIAVAIEGQQPERPMTHDLLGAVLQLLEPGEGTVVIESVDDGIYQATLHAGGHEIDARPSDLVAVAVRLGWRIECTRSLMDHVGVEVDTAPSDEVEAFRAFLDRVTPEDFDDEDNNH
ncbi:bifunctional nuclease family protein [Tessaracoccus lubricantis]|uniref:Bifunctional nuclease family protein n=1 Tax=Tessaracoccus lubricantis TaxID=545543 RepID=A0ABP9FMS7_9ACTN